MCRVCGETEDERDRDGGGDAAPGRGSEIQDGVGSRGTGQREEAGWRQTWGNSGRFRDRRRREGEGWELTEVDGREGQNEERGREMDGDGWRREVGTDRDRE